MVDPDPGLMGIRDWLADHPSQSDPVRQEAFFMGYTALVFRSITYSAWSGYEHYSAHELLEILRMSTGKTATFFVETAFGRALAEANTEIIALIADSGLSPDYVAWAQLYFSVPLDQCREQLATIADSEEREMARLLIGRRFPQEIQADWLVPKPCTGIMLALLGLIIAQRPDLHQAVLDYLPAQPDVLYHRDPDALIAPLVAMSDKAPQAVLLPFTGIYGDGSVVTAAEWHLEHGQPKPAIELASRIRALSQYRDRVIRVQALARIELGEPAAAEAAIASLIDPMIADEIRLSLLEHHVGTVDRIALYGIIDRCTVAQPERFYKALMLLLRSGDRGGAERVCRAKAEQYAEHPTVCEIIATVLRSGASG